VRLSFHAVTVERFTDQTVVTAAEIVRLPPTAAAQGYWGRQAVPKKFLKKWEIFVEHMVK
jgi:hypothetical protein